MRTKSLSVDIHGLFSDGRTFFHASNLQFAYVNMANSIECIDSLNPLFTNCVRA